MSDVKSLSREDRLIKVCESVLDNEPRLLENLAKGNTNEQFYATGKWYDHQRFALKSFFIDNDLEQSKQHFYTCGRLDEFLITKYDEKILDYGISHLSYALLSDKKDVIERYAGLRHGNYEAMIKAGGTAPMYILQCLIKDDWAEYERVMPIMKTKTVKKFKMEMDAAYYEALAERNQTKIEEILSEFVTPKVHKQRNKAHELINEFISHPAIGYAKLAWLKGLYVEIKSPLIPKEFIADTAKSKIRRCLRVLKILNIVRAKQMMYRAVIIILIHLTSNAIGQDLLVPFRVNDTWGYANVLGKIIIPPKYDSVGIFGFNTDSVEVAKIKNQGNYFFINRRGEKIEFSGKELDYNALKEFEEFFIKHAPEMIWGLHRNIYFCYAEGLYGIKSENGCRPLFLNFGFVKDDKVTLKNENGWGLFNLKSMEELTGGYDSILYHYDSEVMIAVKNGKYGLINFRGNVIAKPEFDFIERNPHSKIAMIAKQGNKFGLISFGGKLLVSFQYNSIQNFNSFLPNIYYVQTQDGKYGFIGENGIKYFK